MQHSDIMAWLAGAAWGILAIGLASWAWQADTPVRPAPVEQRDCRAGSGA